VSHDPHNPPAPPPPGLLVTVEGIDGAGKTSLLELLRQHLAAARRPYLLSREPGGTPVGEKLRAIVKDPQSSLTTAGEVFIFLAARAEHMVKVVVPALAEGRVVVLDRFIDSTVAYQGAQLPPGWLREVNAHAIAGRLPNLTILLDLEPEAAAERLEGMNLGADAFDGRGLEFMNSVRARFLTEANRSPERIKVVKANRSPVLVAADAVAHLEAALAARVS
jgi:dTMP kinase